VRGAAHPKSSSRRLKLRSIRVACGRLRKVVIENRDFEPLIRQHDRPDSVFYCNPPYFDTENYCDGVLLRC
jgi:site-specific DNA-adenine methylase